MKPLAYVLLSCMALVPQASDVPPTYKGLTCVGWVKPEAQAVDEGESQGEALVVNTRLTATEKKQLYYAREASAAASRNEQEVEKSILSNHHLLFPAVNGSDWMREGPCGVTPMIRYDEYHITEFVPSNPRYPGDNNWEMVSYRHQDPAKCRAYFADMRKRAEKATYGAGLDTYAPEAK